MYWSIVLITTINQGKFFDEEAILGELSEKLKEVRTHHRHSQDWGSGVSDSGLGVRGQDWGSRVRVAHRYTIFLHYLDWDIQMISTEIQISIRGKVHKKGRKKTKKNQFCPYTYLCPVKTKKKSFFPPYVAGKIVEKRLKRKKN